MTDYVASEGIVIIPRKIGVVAVIGGVVFLGGQIFMYASERSETRGAISALERADTEARTRGDDIRRRISELETNRNNLSDRLTRVEEKIATQTELLREIRDEVKKRP